ncbi:MAG TPA: M23 family metallopeptidase [Candidatus Limnocylindrales bacterium]|nr:M23 family metallopeptidase [Candidatus Limnocylindrales bacterium]
MPRIRHRRSGVVALPLALAGVLSASFSSVPSPPLTEVLGIVPAPVAAAPNATPAPSPARDLRFAYSRPTDLETPRTGHEALAPRPADLTGYVWPLKRGRITLPFKDIPGGTRIRDGKLMHDGLDMATFCGDRVNAAHDGVVLAAGRHFDEFVGWIGDLGPYYRILDRKQLWDDLPLVVVIDDGNGYRSIYAHFSKVSVRAGDVVKAGQRIGFEGATGHASGCHVHYGLFSPLETDTFGVRKDILKRLRLPKLEIARIDPLLVLPFGEKALKTRHVPDVTKLLKAEAAQP